MWGTGREKGGRNPGAPWEQAYLTLAGTYAIEGTMPCLQRQGEWVEERSWKGKD